LFSRKAIGIISHRVEDVESLQTLVTRIDIGGDVPQRMAYMQTRSRRIRKHIEHIVFRPGRIGDRFKSLVVDPVFLPFFFDFGEVIIHLFVVNLPTPGPSLKQGEVEVGGKFSDFTRTMKMHTFDSPTLTVNG